MATGHGLEIGRFSRSAAARRRCFLMSALKGQPTLAQGKREAGGRARRPGSVLQPISLLSPRIACFLGDSGGEAGRGGHVPATSESPASFPHECLVGTKREVCETVEPSPLTLALSPNPRNVLGEREDIVGTFTRG